MRYIFVVNMRTNDGVTIEGRHSLVLKLFSEFPSLFLIDKITQEIPLLKPGDLSVVLNWRRFSMTKSGLTIRYFKRENKYDDQPMTDDSIWMEINSKRTFFDDVLKFAIRAIDVLKPVYIKLYNSEFVEIDWSKNFGKNGHFNITRFCQLHFFDHLLIKEALSISSENFVSKISTKIAFSINNQTGVLINFSNHFLAIKDADLFDIEIKQTLQSSTPLAP